MHKYVSEIRLQHFKGKFVAMNGTSGYAAFVLLIDII